MFMSRFIITLSLIILYRVIIAGDIYKTTSDLKFRKEPNAHSHSIDHIKSGDSVNVIDKTNLEWFKAEHNGKTGYLSSKYLILLRAEQKKEVPKPVEVKVQQDSSSVKYWVAGILTVIILFFIFRKRNKESDSPVLSKPSQNAGNNNSSKQPYTGNYIPESVQRSAFQVLETMHIIGTSKALDTIIGRYDFLLQIFNVLKAGASHPRYVSDITNSVDRYKSMYYDRIPQEYQLTIVAKPNEFDLVNFYCQSLLNAFKRTYEDYTEEVQMLKREDAKIRRREKVSEIFKNTKAELAKRCSNASSYSQVINELEKYFSSSSNESIAVNPIVEPAPQGQNISTITSLKTKIIPANKESEFILNRGASFELTLLNGNEALGKQIQNILKDEKIWEDKKEQQIVALFAEYNLKVKEVEQYREKYGKVYSDKIKELQNSSPEWNSSGEKDREDLMVDFREQAVKCIYEKAQCDLITLFEKEPKDITLDDALIKEYGFENIEVYLRFADNLDKIRVVAGDHYNRPKFEKLVNLGLAIRGSAIPLAEILSALTLKELNEIANNPDKQFKRKNQAIEYITKLDGIEEKLGAKVSLRQLFKLNPLPEKYADINVKEISDTWSYTYEVVSLLVETFRNAEYTAHELKNNEYTKEYTVQTWESKEYLCPCAKTLVNKTYPKNKPPRIPYHLGCTCHLRQTYSI